MPRLAADPAGPLAEDAVTAMAQTPLMARALACLFAAGASLAALTLALPHSPRVNEAGLVTVIVLAYLIAALLFWRSQSMSAVIPRGAVAAGSTLITAVAYFSGQTPSPLIFFYLWVFLYAGYFLTRRQAAVQIAFVGLLYAVLLAADPPVGGGVEWWLVGFGALIVAAALVVTLRARSEKLIARLHDAARTDPLTGLLNRRGFRELLDLEVERARRVGTPVALVTGDLDHFKQVNDRCGHPAGDAALCRAAELLRAGVRQIDGVARVGGEEFALVLPGTDQEGAAAMADRLRLAVGEAFRAAAVPITISFGIALCPEHGATAGSLLQACDEALYAAKQGGRDRVVGHSPAVARQFRGGPRGQDVQEDRFVAVLLELATTVDLRFSGSARHSETVGRYAEMVSVELGLPEERVARVRLAGLLHDVGKVGVPDAILQKPDSLTEEEFALIKEHPALGARLLQHPGLSDVQGWVAAHHERPDGRGYPLGLGAGALALEAQIVAVADAYEAMTSDRPYRRTIGRDAAMAELRRGASTQFDPQVVAAFLRVLERESRRIDMLFRAALEGEHRSGARGAAGSSSACPR